jgi:hypothetical protein
VLFETYATSVELIFMQNVKQHGTSAKSVVSFQFGDEND